MTNDTTLDRKVESEKVGLKLNIQKTKTVASGPIDFMGNRWGNSGNSVRLYIWGAPKSLLMVTAAMKSKEFNPIKHIKRSI